jgi:uncharacterized LabA/DUF88 family protein
MILEPVNKRTVAFFDGQNLYHTAREAFNVPYPNFDPIALTKLLCENQKWNLSAVRFYTGIPDIGVNAYWHNFWSKKTALLKRKGVYVYTRIVNPTTMKEKGIDVKITIDMIVMAQENEYDVALLFSQDQDFFEVARELRKIAQKQGRWIKIACAFPENPQNWRGVEHADWIRISHADYNRCLDPRDYR